jgi:hypothetical protein
MESLTYFLNNSTPPHYSIYNLLEDKEHPLHNALMYDLEKIDPDDLEKHSIKYNVDFFIEGHENKNESRRVWYLKHHLKDAIAIKRKEFLQDYKRSYEQLELGSLNINENGLVSVRDFEYTYSGLIRDNHVFQLSPSLDTANSSYWLFNLILQETFKNNIDFKIRLDPFLKIPQNEYQPMTYMMGVYGITLDWARIRQLKDIEDGKWLGDSNSSACIEFTDYVWAPSKNEIHFTCEELFKDEFIGIRGSRYFHAIFDIKTGLIIHCDGAIRFYSEEELKQRKCYHVKNSEVRKIGKRVKIFQIDEPISQQLFMNLATTFLVWNTDAQCYFNPDLKAKYDLMKNL